MGRNSQLRGLLFFLVCGLTPTWSAPALGAFSSKAVSSRYKSGIKLYREGRYEDAANEFQVAFAMEPRSAKLAYNLARSLEGAKRYDEAITAYRRYLVLAPKAKDREEVMRVIAGLTSLTRQQQLKAPDGASPNAPGPRTSDPPAKSDAPAAEEGKPTESDERGPAVKEIPLATPHEAAPVTAGLWPAIGLVTAGATIFYFGLTKQQDVQNDADVAREDFLDAPIGSADETAARSAYGVASDDLSTWKTVMLIGGVLAATGASWAFYDLELADTDAVDVTSDGFTVVRGWRF